MAILETLTGSVFGAALQRLSRPRSSRVAVKVVGRPPFGRLANYFIPGATHPTDLPRGDVAGRTTDPYQRGYTDWVARNNGVPCGTTRFTLIVQCLGGANVALVGGRAVIDRLEPLSGIAVCHQSGGPIDIFHLKINLDNGAIQCVPALSQPGTQSPIPLQFQINPGASESFEVYAYAGNDAAIWHLELDFVIDGKLVTKTVRSPSGDRFTTIPLNSDFITRRYYPSDTGWVDGSL